MIACEVSQREVCAAVARSRHIIDVDFLPKGLHDIGSAAMSMRLQAAIDACPQTGYDAMLLWYGLCNNGLCDIRASVPLIVPRAHDCITLLLGSRERFARYFESNPGTFFKSPGWIERDSDPNDNPASITTKMKMSRDYRELVEKYGEENAPYLMRTMGDWFKHYHKLAFINTGVGDIEEYRRHAREFASEKHWEYEELEGDSGLLDRMMDGNWDAAEFLIVRPGQTIKPTHGPDIIQSA
jgi:hypothetical protein